MNYENLFNSNMLSESYQLKLPLELDFLISKDDSVRVLNLIIDSINLSNLEKLILENQIFLFQEC